MSGRDAIQLCLWCDISLRQWLSYPLLQASTDLIWPEVCWMLNKHSNFFSIVCIVYNYVMWNCFNFIFNNEGNKDINIYSFYYQANLIFIIHKTQTPLHSTKLWTPLRSTICTLHSTPLHSTQHFSRCHRICINVN